VTALAINIFTNPSQNFPKLKTHSDLTSQPMTTYVYSQNIYNSEDLPGYRNSNCIISGNNWIADENKKPGVKLSNKDWLNVDYREPSGSALWLNKTSVNCGETVDVHASLYGNDQFAFLKGKRNIEVLRIGWYNGAGARVIWRSPEIQLKREKVPLPANNLRMVETKWPTTLKINIGRDWTPGFYLVVTKSPEDKIENVAPLVVKSPRSTSKILLMHSFLTWNLYNNFGGHSAYFGHGDSKITKREDRSRVVSLDRPIMGSGGYSIHRDAISMVTFMEKNGFNYDQETDFDVDNYPSIIDSYNELILSGHAEYMTRRIFESIVASRNNGVNLAIFGGNTALWQTRVTASRIGKDRRIIMYRSATEDPVTDIRQVSIEFRDHRINMPQTLFTGTEPSGTHVYGDLKAVRVPNWSGLKNNSEIIGFSPDSEVEEIIPNSPASPNKVNVIFHGDMRYSDPTTTPYGAKTTNSDVVWFTSTNGQATFNAGITNWACNLVDVCSSSSVDEKSRAVLSQLTSKVITLWQERGVGAKLKN